jgi:hypothetical protein
MYAAKRFSCGPGAVSAPTKQFYIKLFVYNTVVLGGVPGEICTTRMKTVWLDGGPRRDRLASGAFRLRALLRLYSHVCADPTRAQTKGKIEFVREVYPKKSPVRVAGNRVVLRTSTRSCAPGCGT